MKNLVSRHHVSNCQCIDQFVLSPVPARDGVIYILNAKSGQGKTFGVRNMLEIFYEFDPGPPGEHIKGFMITGQDLDDDYNASLRRMRGASEVDGWMHALLLALEQPKGCQPGLLILDNFNSL
jgi:hypothetical protein